MVPGPAVRGKVSGMIEISSWLSSAENPFFSESILKAIVTSRIPPAIWKEYTSRLNIWKRSVPVRAKKAKIMKPNFVAFAAIFRFFSGFLPFVRDMNTAVVLSGFITATIDEIATIAKSIVENVRTSLGAESCYYI